MGQKIRVLVVDDSALARKIISDMLNQNPDIEVVGTANDGAFVISKIKLLKPDIITLDVEMRNKGGLEILPEIVQHGIPAIMVSAHTDRGAQATIKALELGAIDFVTKPQAGNLQNLAEIMDSLAQKIIAVARARQRKRFIPRTTPSPTTGSSVAIPSRIRPKQPIARSAPISASLASVKPIQAQMIAIGASTGGTEAIKDVLLNLPTNLPGIVIVQHMPAGFTKAFSSRLDGLCKIKVKEAEDGDFVLPGTALIAPGSHHVEVYRVGMKLKVRLLETAPVNRHRPSVEVLFNSVANTVGKKVLGIMLTGMGADGADGLKKMRDAGALTVAQDEESCVVFGMPKEAIKRGGACYVLPLNQIGAFTTKITS